MTSSPGNPTNHTQHSNGFLQQVPCWREKLLDWDTSSDGISSLHTVHAGRPPPHPPAFPLPVITSIAFSGKGQGEVPKRGHRAPGTQAGFLGHCLVGGGKGEKGVLWRLPFALQEQTDTFLPQELCWHLVGWKTDLLEGSQPPPPREWQEKGLLSRD